MSHVTPAVPLLVVLFSVLMVCAVSSCNPYGPRDCTFSRNACGWGLGNGWSIEWHCCSYVLEFDDEPAGRIESRTACSTGGSTHCLKFEYWFESDYVADLNVIIRPVSSQTGEALVWTTASSSWREYNAEVPINTDDNFTVIIEAKTRDGQKSDSYVYIDDIEYERSSCNIQPSGAVPPTTTTTTTTSTTMSTTTTTTKRTTTYSTSTTASATTTEPATTKSSDEGGTSGQTTATREAHTEPTSPATTPVTADQAASSQSQDDVATIVGTVVGVVVVVVVAVVLLFVFRRKQLLFCFKSDKQRGEHSDVTSSHNAAYSLDLGDQGETSDMKMTAINTEHHSPPLKATAPPHSSDDYYNIVNTPHKDATPEPPNQMYAAVNKPRRPNPATANTTRQQAMPLPSDQMYAALTKAHRPNPGPQPTVTDPAEDSPYEIGDDTPDCTAHQPAGDALAQQLYDVPPGARTTPPNPTHSAQECHKPSMKSQDEDGDYNSLDLGGRRPVEERGEGEEVGNVYSGLNEGDGDTYSEVTHHRRREVIDDQYSFFQ